MEEKKKKNKFFIILYILFFMFLCLYCVNKSGYYEKINRDKTLYVEEQMRLFENDVLNGEYVDFDSYILDQKQDYANEFSRFGEKSSLYIEKFFVKLLDFFKVFFEYLFK